MTMYRMVWAASLAAALAACGGNQEQAGDSATIEPTTPAGNAGPPPGASPGSGLGDANTAPTSAPEQPQPVDGSTVGADGGNGMSTTGGTSQSGEPTDQTQDATTPPAQ